jgi:hypothetical protein
MSIKKISPLKRPPLHNPGQSLDEEIDRVFYDEAIYYVTCVIFVIYIAGMEWYRWFFPSHPHPWILTSIAVVCLGYYLIKLRRSFIKLRALHLGRDGEKIVGQYLEELREKGYRVLHDIVGDGFNVDHVVISPNGIYAIETKTLSKNTDKNSKVIFDGNKLLIDGFENNQYLTQVKSESSWLNNLLKESTGKSFSVKPVIVFPDWYVDSVGPDVHKDIWVLNPKALPVFIANDKVVLQQEDVQLATYHLSCYIRSLKK